MNLLRKAVAFTMSVVFATWFLASPLQPAQADLSPGYAGTPPDMPQATFADLWRVDHTFQSTIRLRNLLTFRPLEVTPVLYMADGAEYDLPPMTLAASGIADVNVNEALNNAPSNIAAHASDFGSAALKYRYFSSLVVAGEITMVDVPRSLVFSSPFQMPMMAMNPTSGTQTLEGLWWKHDPGTGGFVNVSNTTEHVVNVSLQVTGARGASQQEQTVQLGPHTEKMLDLDSLASVLPNPNDQAGGISVQYAGQMGDLVVSGGLENDKEGYSSFMPFWQHDSASAAKQVGRGSAVQSDTAENGSTPGPSSLSLGAIGLMVGQPDPSQGFPGGTHFTPYLALRNTTAKPMTLSSTLYLTNGSRTLSFGLPGEKLAPHEARQVNMAEQLKRLGLQDFNGMINVTVAYTGRVADLLMASGAVDQTSSYVFAVFPQLLLEGMAKDSAWMVGDGYDSMFTLWNPKNQPEDLVAIFSYADGSGSYRLPVHLDSYASQTIDVASLIAAQRPDTDGNVIPRGVMEGRVIISSPQGLDTSINLALSSSAFNVTAATCCPNCTCCVGVTQVVVSPASGATITGVGNTTQMTFNVYMSGSNVPCDESSVAAWDTDEHGSATVNTTTNRGLVTAVAGGGANVFASANLPPNGQICACSPGCPAQPFSNFAQVTTKANVVISATSVSPTAINTSTLPNSATVSVQVFHEPVDPNHPQTVDVNVGTFSTSPATGVSVSYNPPSTQLTVSGAQGSSTKQFEVSGPSLGSNPSATIQIASSLTSPSAGLNVQAPNPASNGLTTLSITNR